MKAFVASVRDTIPRFPSVYVGLVNNRSVNAWAILHEGNYFIALTTGAVFVTHSLFSRMMADKRILPNIGNIENELAESPPPSSVDPDEIMEATIAVAITNPRDPIRRVFRDHLSMMVMDFLIAHEVAHIANGHTSLDANGGASFISEFGSTPILTRNAMLSQTFEIDADCMATSNGVGNLIRKTLRNKPSPPFGQFYEDIVQSSFNWTFAANSFFRLHGDDSIPDTVSDRKHPPWRVRHLISSNTFISFIQREVERNVIPIDLVERIVKMNAAATLQVEQAFSLLSGESGHSDGLKEVWGGRGWEYVELLLNHWKTELRSRLKPHAFNDSLQE